MSVFVESVVPLLVVSLLLVSVVLVSVLLFVVVLEPVSVVLELLPVEPPPQAVSIRQAIDNNVSCLSMAVLHGVHFRVSE